MQHLFGRLREQRFAVRSNYLCVRVCDVSGGVSAWNAALPE